MIITTTCSTININRELFVNYVLPIYVPQSNVLNNLPFQEEFGVGGHLAAGVHLHPGVVLVKEEDRVQVVNASTVINIPKPMLIKKTLWQSDFVNSSSSTNK